MVFSKIYEEHLFHLENVFEILRENKLLLNGKKCKYAKTSLMYLGHMMGDKEKRIDPSKVKAIVNFVKAHSNERYM